MHCTACDINTGFGGSNFKLEYLGISIDGFLYGARIVYATPGNILKPAAQKIADHVWESIYNYGEKKAKVYTTLTAIINPNGSVFVKLTIYLENVTYPFTKKKKLILSRMYAGGSEFDFDTEIIVVNCSAPETYDGKALRPVGPNQKPID